MKSNVIMRNFKKSVIDKDYNSSIYRCIHFERLLEMLLHKNIVLVKTRMWEDPYENFLFNTKIRSGAHYTSLGSFTDSLYGHCWTMKKDTDALWRIYSPTKQAVIIKTKISKLAKPRLNLCIVQHQRRLSPQAARCSPQIDVVRVRRRAFPKSAR